MEQCYRVSAKAAKVRAELYYAAMVAQSNHEAAKILAAKCKAMSERMHQWKGKKRPRPAIANGRGH